MHLSFSAFCSDCPPTTLNSKRFKSGSAGNGELGRPSWPLDWIHSDGSGVHQVRVEESLALGPVQLGPLYLIQATVRPVHRSTKVVNGKSFGAYQTWKLNKGRTGAEGFMFEQLKKKKKKSWESLSGKNQVNGGTDIFFTFPASASFL